ncbi:DUF4388 domain-containing protein [Myxococcota bacterium]|nr:DUF4388 domain-containing protein [Myxococcota bacterium]
MGATTRVFIVDDEEDLVRALERRLSAALPGVEVLGFTAPLVALETLQSAEPALVITDVRMPGITGIELLIHARARWPALPFIVMTAFPTESVEREANTLGVHYVAKPFKIQALVELAAELLARRDQPGFSGAVSAATLPDLIQLFLMSGSTGVLRVWHGAREGDLWFDRGAIIHATAGELVGRSAVFEVVSWTGGKFAMDLQVAPPARTVTESTTGLVLEALRRTDERRHGPSEGGEDQRRGEDIEDDYIELSDDLEIRPTSSDERGDEDMPNNVQNTLEKLRAIDGYIGACVVDSESAMSLGSDGGGSMLNLDVAAAGNAEVVKAKRKTIRALGLKDEVEDILISLSKQYHLIRPLRVRPGVFIYVALDRARANLAMARMTVSDVEKTLEL